jgi:ribosome biogenesis GTPase
MNEDHSPDEEEHYFGDRRKERKQARKLASAKDRSKYKKTDQAKRSGTRPLPAPESSKHGRVVAIISDGFIVQRDVDGQRFACGLRGLLKKEKTQAKNLVGVGDFVWFSETASDTGVIDAIEPRRTILVRADNLSRRKEQLIAANIDQVLITVSVVDPALKPALVDRYIIASQKGGMAPVIVVNKIDLLVAGSEEQQLFENFCQAYRSTGIPVIPVSATTGDGLDALRDSMKGNASVFAGQSGVGKSSLINAITGLDLRVRETVEKTGKGSHTTTHAQLLPLNFGGWCIDTPGIKSFGVWDLLQSEVEAYFPDIFEIGRQCKFADCSHTGELGCAVIEAVNRGEVSPLRFDSYCGLIASIDDKHLRR